MLSDLAKDLRDTLTTEPQTRADLCDILSCDDRTLRYAVAELREHGFNVASSSHASGYWWGNTEEIARLAREYDARGTKDLRIAAALRKGPDMGQMEVEL